MAALPEQAFGALLWYGPATALDMTFRRDVVVARAGPVVI
jgi:hypothetical protein